MLPDIVWVANGSLEFIVSREYLKTIRGDLIDMVTRDRFDSPYWPRTVGELLANKRYCYPHSKLSVKILNPVRSGNFYPNPDDVRVKIRIKAFLSKDLPVELIQDILTFTKDPIKMKDYETTDAV